MEKENQLRLLRKAFSDISRGYSVVFLEGKKLYIKHLSHHEQVDLDVLYKSFFDEGIKEGLNTEAQVTARLREEGVWKDEDEKELADSKSVIERLVAGKKVIYMKSDLERQNEEIKKEEQKYAQKLNLKHKLLGLTAEAFAEKKINEHYIMESIFWDAQCTKKYLTDDLFEEMTDKTLHDIIQFYNTEMDVVSDKHIKHLALQDFFQIYWNLSGEDLYSFYGKAVCELTYFQVKLGSFARTFKHILEKADSLPEDIRSDPDKILDYVRTSENAKEKMEQAASTSKGNEGEVIASSIMGAKMKDYEEMGIRSDPGTTTLSAELKKKKAEGKNGLDMHDLMKIMGV